MFESILSLFLSVSYSANGCKDGTLSINKTDKSVGKGFVQFEVGKPYKYCFKLPKVEYPKPEPGKPGKNPFVTLNVINLGNASCSDLEVTMIRPNKPDILGNMSARRGRSNGPSPVIVQVYTPGKWRLKFKLNEGCDKYKFYASWSL